MLRVVSISIFFHLWEFLVLFPPLLLIRSFPLLFFLSHSPFGPMSIYLSGFC